MTLAHAILFIPSTVPNTSDPALLFFDLRQLAVAPVVARLFDQGGGLLPMARGNRLVVAREAGGLTRSVDGCQAAP